MSSPMVPGSFRSTSPALSDSSSEGEHSFHSLTTRPTSPGASPSLSSDDEEYSDLIYRFTSYKIPIATKMTMNEVTKPHVLASFSFGDEECSDLTIVNGEHEWKVHRLVVGKQSPVFARLSSEAPTVVHGVKTVHLDVPGIAATVHRVLEYLYKQNFHQLIDFAGDSDSKTSDSAHSILNYDLKQVLDNITSVVALSEYLAVPQLRQCAIQKFDRLFSYTISTPQFIEYIRLAYQMTLPPQNEHDPCRKVLLYCNQNLSKLCVREDFNSLIEKHPKFASDLLRKDLKCQQEHQRKLASDREITAKETARLSRAVKILQDEKTVLGEALNRIKNELASLQVDHAQILVKNENLRKTIDTHASQAKQQIKTVENYQSLLETTKGRVATLANEKNAKISELEQTLGRVRFERAEAEDRVKLLEKATDQLIYGPRDLSECRNCYYSLDAYYYEYDNPKHYLENQVFLRCNECDTRNGPPIQL